jgi:hypothetical protein
LAVCLLAVGLSVGGWALTHRSEGLSCQDFSQPHADRGHTHVGMSSLARVESVTLSPVSGGLQVLWQFNQEEPNLGHEAVGDLEVDIRQNSRRLILAVPTIGSTAWAEMGPYVKVVKAQQRPWEVLVTYSRSQVFQLTGSFLWNAGVEYGVVYGATSSCPGPGSNRLQAG